MLISILWISGNCNRQRERAPYAEGALAMGESGSPTKVNSFAPVRIVYWDLAGKFLWQT
jgi:hypothetical protein